MGYFFDWKIFIEAKIPLKIPLSPRQSPWKIGHLEEYQVESRRPTFGHKCFQGTQIQTYCFHGSEILANQLM